MVFSIGDEVRYSRGARWTVRGRTGIVRGFYHAHGQLMLTVDFGSEVYPCWTENVDLLRPAQFDDVEVTTAA